MVNADFTAYTIYNKDRDEYVLNESAFNADMYYILETKKQYTKGFDIKGTFNEVLEVQKVDLPASITFSDLVGFFNQNNVEGEVDWSIYINKTEWITLIEASYKLYKKVWKDYTYTKQMVDNYGNSWELLKVDIKNMFRKGNRYTRKEIKERLQKLYDSKSIVRKAKYSDLYEVYNKVDIKEGAVNGERYLEIK